MSGLKRYEIDSYRSHLLLFLIIQNLLNGPLEFSLMRVVLPEDFYFVGVSVDEVLVEIKVLLNFLSIPNGLFVSSDC